MATKKKTKKAEHRVEHRGTEWQLYAAGALGSLAVRVHDGTPEPGVDDDAVRCAAAYADALVLERKRLDAEDDT